MSQSYIFLAIWIPLDTYILWDSISSTIAINNTLRKGQPWGLSFAWGLNKLKIENT